MLRFLLVLVFLLFNSSINLSSISLKAFVALVLIVIQYIAIRSYIHYSIEGAFYLSLKQCKKDVRSGYIKKPCKKTLSERLRMISHSVSACSFCSRVCFGKQVHNRMLNIKPLGESIIRGTGGSRMAYALSNCLYSNHYSSHTNHTWDKPLVWLKGHTP